MTFISRNKKPSDLDPLSLGLTIGILYAFSVLFLGILSYIIGGDKFNFLLSVYPMFSDTLIGAVVGSVIGFIDGFISGFIISILYNLIKNRLS